MRTAAWIGGALALAATGCEAATPPHLDTVVPTMLSPGEMFTLTGERLCQSAMVNADGTCPDGVPGDVDIDIDFEAKAPVLAWSDTMITATLPVHGPHGATTVFVYSHDVSSNALGITVP